MPCAYENPKVYTWESVPWGSRAGAAKAAPDRNTKNCYILSQLGFCSPCSQTLSLHPQSRHHNTVSPISPPSDQKSQTKPWKGREWVRVFLPTLVCVVHSLWAAASPSQGSMLHESQGEQGCPDWQPIRSSSKPPILRLQQVKLCFQEMYHHAKNVPVFLWDLNSITPCKD